jgi:glucokinase
MKYAIGVDLGGSHTMAAVVDSKGKILEKFKRDLSSLDVTYVVGEVAHVIGKALKAVKGRDLVGIGLGSPGSIDERNGDIRYSPNFGWRNVPLGRLLEKKCGRGVHILNDARCATLGEADYGTGRGARDFALITLGTGIGGGFIANGKLVIGRSMGAGEVGHHQIRPDTGFTCTCGKRGCFEAQASGTGLIRHALALAPSYPRSTLLAGDSATWGSKGIREAMVRGDQHAVAAWKCWMADLAIGVSNIVAMMNPEIIALGGGAGQADKKVLSGPLTTMVDELTIMSPRGKTKIVSAKLGNDAGAVGAATLAFHGGVKGLLKE